MFKNNEEVEIDLSNLRFIYFGRKTEDGIDSNGNPYTKHTHDGVVCVGYESTVVDGKASTIMGFSFCSPQDSFSRVKARTVISNRINAGKNIVVETGGDKVPTYEQVITLAKGILTASLPEGIDIAEVEHTEDCPKVGGVKLPRWFDPESL